MNPVKITWVKGTTVFLLAVGVSFFIGSAYFDKYPPTKTTNSR
jgi:ABC-type uncharacterized transport system permease subunit